MPKAEKVKVNVKDKVKDDVCDLSLSELSEVPAREIAAFPRVTTLDLSSNRLASLGKNFIVLKRLVKLDLSKNQLRYLPDEFGQLENLRHLNLYDNKLEHIPLTIGNLRRLRYLDLKRNPLAPAWQNIVGPCSTTKECQDAAKKTVNICASMYKKYLEEQQQQQVNPTEGEQAANGESENPSNSKKSKKSKANQIAANNGIKTKPKTKSLQQNNGKFAQDSPNEPKRKKTPKKSSKASRWGAAFSTIMWFFFLIAINFLIVYLIMFKNPEFAETAVGYIPNNYRSWILKRIEFFRLHVTDWISEFITEPEEN